MTLADVCLMVSVLVVVTILAKMLRAIRLLEGRVTVLQEELAHSRTTMQGAGAGKPTAAKPASARTPLAGVPVIPTAAPGRLTPAPEGPASLASGEGAAHVIDQAEADAVWARLEAEQERLRKAMGRDFQVRTRKRSASEIRGRPVARALSAQELAKKLERR